MRDPAVLGGPRAAAYGRLCAGGQGAHRNERTPIPVTDIFDEAQWRGLVAQTTDEAALREALAEGPLTLYCGFDPSAPSLHFGNFVRACPSCAGCRRPATTSSASSGDRRDSSVTPSPTPSASCRTRTPSLLR